MGGGQAVRCLHFTTTGHKTKISLHFATTRHRPICISPQTLCPSASQANPRARPDLGRVAPSWISLECHTHAHAPFGGRKRQLSSGRGSSSRPSLRGGQGRSSWRAAFRPACRRIWSQGDGSVALAQSSTFLRVGHTNCVLGLGLFVIVVARLRLPLPLLVCIWVGG